MATYGAGAASTAHYANDIDVTIPAHSDGDLLLMFLSVGEAHDGSPPGNQYAPNTPAGWTEAAAESDGVHFARLYWKIASSEPAAVNVDNGHSGGLEYGTWNAFCFSVEDAEATDPFVEITTATGTETAPAVQVQDDASLVFRMWACEASASTFIGDFSGQTWRKAGQGNIHGNAMVVSEFQEAAAGTSLAASVTPNPSGNTLNILFSVSIQNAIAASELGAGVIHAWSFDEAPNTIIDAAGSDDLPATGNPGSTVGVHGTAGSTVSTNHIFDTMSSAGESLPLTLAGWLKIPTNVTAAYCVDLLATGGLQSVKLALGTNKSIKPQLNAVTPFSDMFPKPGDWSFVCLRLQSHTVELRVDGAESKASHSHSTFGDITGGAIRFFGDNSFDEWEMWDRRLTNDEVDQLSYRWSSSFYPHEDGAIGIAFAAGDLEAAESGGVALSGADLEAVASARLQIGGADLEAIEAGRISFGGADLDSAESGGVEIAGATLDAIESGGIDFIGADLEAVTSARIGFGAAAIDSIESGGIAIVGADLEAVQSGGIEVDSPGLANIEGAGIAFHGGELTSEAVSGGIDFGSEEIGGVETGGIDFGSLEINTLEGGGAGFGSGGVANVDGIGFIFGSSEINTLESGGIGVGSGSLNTLISGGIDVGFVGFDIEFPEDEYGILFVGHRLFANDFHDTVITNFKTKQATLTNFRS